MKGIVQKESLLHQVWQDSQENTLSFGEKNLEGAACTKDRIWLCLDEGSRCGGKCKEILCTTEQIVAELQGCGKRELCDIFLKEIAKYSKNDKDTFGTK